MFKLNNNLWEGTLADILIRYKYKKLFYGIQIKTTKKISKKKRYQFNHTKGYEGLILICVCIDENKIWVMPGEITKNMDTLNIGGSKSKYYGYLIKDNLCEKITNIIKNNELILKSFDDWNIPISKLVKREKEYFYLHKSKFPFKLKRPKVENGHIDSYIKLNNIKIRFQHKVSFIKKNEKVSIPFDKMAGKINKKCTRKPYEVDDFDILFIHIDNENYLNKIILIPSSDLLERKYFKNKECKGLTKIVFPMDFVKCKKIAKVINKWVVKNYLFDLDEDKEKIKNLLINIAEYKKNQNYIEEFPRVPDFFEYYGPKNLRCYIETFKNLCIKNNLNQRFENYNQFKLFIKNYKEEMKILRPESAYKKEWNQEEFLKNINLLISK